MSQNRLSNCTSPYLQQHADNPVDWQPWDKESLRQAKEQDKPILLSIGYSACHWCHVMAHESFEDEATAAEMNRLFINIKVDREERPDLDKIYQSAHQLLAQRPGGWPLTVFLTPDDQTPFFAGTYFPKQARHGLPPFVDILHNIAQAYREQKQDIQVQNQALLNAISQLNPKDNGENAVLNSGPLESARQQLTGAFDERYGGFGQAPKFPHPASLNRLLRHWSATTGGDNADARALYAVDFTLTRMALGGINDQLGGGFCRYSVDDQWMIPHFEKMLYDNGPLLSLYTDLWQATGKPLFRETAQQTADWVMREMQSSEGGYYSTLDADSEGEEGRFYVWRPDEAKALLSEAEYQHLSHYYGLDRKPNFEGSWHLHNYASIADLNSAYGTTGEEARTLLQTARNKLYQAREIRIRPGRDEKILTSWNALMIKGMARSGRLLGQPQMITSAEQAISFIKKHLWKEGRLLASHKDGTSAFAAYLDDYAYLIDALLELLQARWKSEDLTFATELAQVLLDHFQDHENGGFFFTADDHEQLIHRAKPFGDDSTPAGNGVAAFALSRLGHLLGETDYLDAAEATLKCAWPHLLQLPHAHCSLLEALEAQIYPTETIIIRGEEKEMEAWSKRATRNYAPRRLTLAIPASETALPGLLEARKGDKGVIAYICKGTACEAPIRDYTAFDKLLTDNESMPAKSSDQDFTGSVGSYKRARE